MLSAVSINTFITLKRLLCRTFEKAISPSLRMYDEGLITALVAQTFYCDGCYIRTAPMSIKDLL